MTNVLIGALLAVGCALTVEGLLLFGRAQNLLNYAEDLLARAEPPLLPAEKQPTPTKTEITAVITDLPTEPLPVQPRPTPGPATVPIEEAITVTAIAPDDEWMRSWREQTDADIAAMRARWDEETAA